MPLIKSRFKSQAVPDSIVSLAISESEYNKLSPFRSNKLISWLYL